MEAKDTVMNDIEIANAQSQPNLGRIYFDFAIHFRLEIVQLAGAINGG